MYNLSKIKGDNNNRVNLTQIIQLIIQINKLII